jgi:hypothetical protein
MTILSKIMVDKIIKNNNIKDATALLDSTLTPCSYEKKNIDNPVFSSLPYLLTHYPTNCKHEFPKYSTPCSINYLYIFYH